MMSWCKLIKDSKQIPLILGRFFLATANATINYRLEVIDISVMNMRVRLNIFKTSCQPVFEDEFECFFSDVINEIIEEASSANLSNDPLGACLFRGDLRLLDVECTIDGMYYNIDSSPPLESSAWVSTYKPFPPLASSPMPHFVVFPA